jgi:cytochrome c oxidase cbb3-type subunit 2
MRHETIEKNINVMIVLIVLAISIGGLVEIIPLMFSADATEPDENIEVYSALRLAGRDVYVREGCYGCHSQQIRPFRSETERYGPYSTAGEAVYDRPFQFGSKRTGPILLALAVDTAMPGSDCIWSSHGHWSLSRICRATPG